MINDRLIDAGELPIAVRDFGGDRPPLLLLHGAGGNLAQMTTLARELRPHHRVITMDLRGHGRSGDGTWTWDAALADLAAVAVHLDLQNPAVVGHSLGGMLAALWGQRHPESAGVVSLDGNPPPTRADQLPGLAKPDDELARLHAIFDTIEATAGATIPNDQLPALIEQQREAARRLGANEKVWIEGFRRNLTQSGGESATRPPAATVTELRTLMNALDLTPVYAATTCPELVVLPTRDLPEQEAFAELYAAYRTHLVEQARTAGVQFIQLEGASHAMVAEQPAELAALVTSFLQGRRRP